MNELSEAGLLLIGHGSSKQPEGARASVEAHAERVRSMMAFACVASAFLKGGPAPADALASLNAETVFVVPHFMSRGYFVRTRIPEILGLEGSVTPRGAGELRYCDPPALSPAFAGLAKRRIESAASQAGVAPHAPCLVVGHGSASDRSSEDATRELVRALVELGLDASAAFVEQAPFFTDAVASRSGPLIVAGFFAADGFHAEADVRALLAGRPAAAYTGALGTDPDIARLIVETARSIAAG